MNATNQLFGVCDSSGAQKSTVTSPQSADHVAVDNIANGQPPVNHVSSSSAYNKINSSNQPTCSQVSMKLLTDIKIRLEYYDIIRIKSNVNKCMN